MKWCCGADVAVVGLAGQPDHVVFNLCLTVWFLRMRASLFVNLVAMRSALSSRTNPPVHLTDANLRLLQKSVYLFHSAHS